MNQKQKEKALLDLFEPINKRLFNASLIRPKIKVINTVEMIGLSILHFKELIPFEGITIKDGGDEYIAICSDLSASGAFHAFVHELVHVWQAQNNKPLDHGKAFNKKCLQAYEIFILGHDV